MPRSNRIPPHAWPHRFYKRRVYPRVSHVRGSYRLGVYLSRLAQIGLEKIDQREAEGVYERDWDNLVILDACRHDLYQEVEGPADHRYTLGSSSSEFMARNFSSGTHDDTVYVSANPHIHESQFRSLTGRKPGEVFHTVFHTYKNRWNDEHGTVMPEAVVDDAATAEKLFPDKRKIIHFMQPHHPFIGYDYGLDTEGFPQDIQGGETPETIWEYAERGLVSDEELWKGYRATLEVVLEWVDELLRSVEGKTVVTADHGNLVGEHGLYAHPEGSRAELLRKVPWDVVQEE